MKPARILLACVFSSGLAACGSDPQVDARNASAEEVAKEVAAAGGSDNFVRPDQAHVNESCLTAEEAKRPKEDFFAGSSKNCRYDRFTMTGGKIDAVMKCTEGGMSQTMAMQGSYGPDAYQMRMSMKADAGAGPPGGMTMTMRVDAKRIGECDPKKA